MAELLSGINGVERFHLRRLMNNPLRDLVMQKEKTDEPPRNAARRRLRHRLSRLGGLLSREAQAAEASFNPLAPKEPHFAPRAKRVIFLFMHGGHRASTRSIRSRASIAITASRCRSSARWRSPTKKPAADEIAVGVQERRPERHSGQRTVPPCPRVRRRSVRHPSMVGEGVDHGAALLQSFTGTSTFTRPSMGSWVVYGLGTENQNLPGFITIKPALSHGGAKNWSSAFLPGAYQGTAIGHAGLKVDEFGTSPSSIS